MKVAIMSRYNNSINAGYPSNTVFVIIFICSLVCSSIPPVENASILAVQIVPAKSHWNFMNSILRALTERGHHVTVFTPFSDGGDRDNYTEVDTSGQFPTLLEMDLADTLIRKSRPTSMVKVAQALGTNTCDIIYANDRLKEIMRNDGQPIFDLIVTETLGSDCVSYLSIKLNLPTVHLIASPMITYAERSLLGHIPNPATVSHSYYYKARPKTFSDRLHNTALSTYSVLYFGFREWTVKFTNPKPYNSIARPVQASLLFVNSHYISEPSRPFPPTVVQVGGIHLKPPKSLPKDILEFIENSPNGVILFTFGSTIKVSSIPEHIMNIFKNALARVPQRILWKYEEEMKNKPKNVMIAKWLPQRDILMHPNVKLFISHGGISGLYETVDAGVPVLGIPLYYDQPKNIDNLVNAGMAISMDILSVREDTFLRNVLELVNNITYVENAKIASEQFKDRPMSPDNSVVYWTEYVIRHKGAPHLKSHALNISWYQYLLLDVMTVIIGFVAVILFVLYTVLKNINHYIVQFKLKTKTKSD
ncbi:UDP-glucuronosyl/UDP-glucosyltransferase [Cinara cedri]|uniref:UDP-glucuronosyltransferase n=1 Tax=Cinara cedri TaxID=506608 RepID=A0A5E4MTE5_9HEMI|nr:UDP-glucuronosyl/UDP-glucosyltransferase [Cinara cedri]